MAQHEWPSTATDPLGVRAATAWVVEQARDVTIDATAVEHVAEQIRKGAFERPSWRVLPHWWSDADPEATARYVLLLDALNFSFWGEPKWHVRYAGATYDGYWALAACLRRAVDAGGQVLDPAFLVAGANAGTLLAGADGTTIPLLRARQAALREVGSGIESGCDGSVLACIGRAAQSAHALVRIVLDQFPSFRDVSEYEGRSVPLYKRAQILVSDIWGAFEGTGPGRFDDLGTLTMFADYKVPQVLHGLGVLRYSDGLTQVLQACELLPYGDRREVEIRAASVQAVERILAALAAQGVPATAVELDWMLWELGQGRAWPLPYHRTRSVAY